MFFQVVMYHKFWKVYFRWVFFFFFYICLLFLESNNFSTSNLKVYLFMIICQKIPEKLKTTKAAINIILKTLFLIKSILVWCFHLLENLRMTSNKRQIFVFSCICTGNVCLYGEDGFVSHSIVSLTFIFLMRNHTILIWRLENGGKKILFNILCKILENVILSFTIYFSILLKTFLLSFVKKMWVHFTLIFFILTGECMCYFHICSF